MINLDLRATYGGMACAEVVKTVQALRSMGFSDEEINEMLEKNKMDEPTQTQHVQDVGSVGSVEEG